CLVVAAEEADWLTCDAYRKWRLLRSAPPLEPFHEPPRGMILSEGAGAILLARRGPVLIEKISGGTNFQKQRAAPRAVESVFSELCRTTPGLVVVSANGTFIDRAEQAVIQKYAPYAEVYAIKAALGESVGASSLWQTISAAQILIQQRRPGLPDHVEVRDALVSTCGLSQQVAGLLHDQGARAVVAG